MRIIGGKVENHPGGYAKVTVVVDGDKQVINDVMNHPDTYQLVFEKKRKKRSMTANDYYHALLDKLASKLRASRDELHRTLLMTYGTLKTDEDGHIKKVLIKTGEDPDDIVPYSVYLQDIQVEDDVYKVYGVLKGSSEMNNAEFARLLDGLIYECKELGIETIPKTELERYIKWN